MWKINFKDFSYGVQKELSSFVRLSLKHLPINHKQINRNETELKINNWHHELSFVSNKMKAKRLLAIISIKITWKGGDWSQIDKQEIYKSLTYDELSFV